MADRSKRSAKLIVAIAAALGGVMVSGVTGLGGSPPAAPRWQTDGDQDPRQASSSGEPQVREKGTHEQTGVAVPSSKAAVLRQQGRKASVFSQPLVRRGLADDGLRARFVPGHIVVKFMPSTSVRAMQLMAGEVKATAMSRPSYADFYYVTIPVDTDPVAAAARLAEQPDVVYAEPDPTVFPTYVPNDPYYKYQWHFKKIGMEQAWDVNRGGSSRITVAVVDTGVAYLNKGAFAQAPDLAGTSIVGGYDFIWDTAEPVDLDGHGTHIAGTIAQTTGNSIGVAGIAFNVKLMPVKVLFGDWDEAWHAPDPYGASTTSRGIRFAVDHGARIINLSLGSLGPNTATLDAIRYAVANGAFVAIAAGNEALRGNAPVWPASYAKDIDGAVAVAALDGKLKRAPYSSIQDYVEIAAPGGDTSVDTDGDGYADGVLQQTYDPDAVDAGIFNKFAYMFYQGTSMATAHVSGLAALLMDQGYTSPKAIEAAMKQFATDIPPAGRDNETGYGMINPRATLRGLGLRK